MIPSIPTVAGIDGITSSAYASSSVKWYESSGFDAMDITKLAGKYFWVTEEKGVVKYHCSNSKNGKGNVFFSKKKRDREYSYPYFLNSLMTNGSKVYFTFYDEDTEKYTMYSSSLSGKNRKKLKTFDERIKLLALYNSKIYFQSEYNESYKLKSYNLKSGKIETCVKEWGEKISIDNRRGIIVGSTGSGITMGSTANGLNIYNYKKGKNKIVGKGYNIDDAYSGWKRKDDTDLIYFCGYKGYELDEYGIYSQTIGKNDLKMIAEIPYGCGFYKFNMKKNAAILKSYVDIGDGEEEVITYSVNLKNGKITEVDRVIRESQDYMY